MIRAYPDRASVAPGERLTLHVSSDAARFNVAFYRWAEGLAWMGECRGLAGKPASAGTASEDWGWPAYELRVPAHWPSGVYVAHFDEPGAYALFVVRGRGDSRLLYKIPFATYHAYNRTGGGCFYVDPARCSEPEGSKVTLRRPGGGIGGEVWGAVDHYDANSPRQTFAHWDAPFIRWLFRHGYEPEFCADLDLHDDPWACSPYRLLLNVGHDEYWSEPMRDAVERFVANTGNVAFLGANVCWWRIHLADDDSAMVCHQGGPRGALDQWWPACGAARAEDSLTGASYRHGGGWWDGPRRTQGYFVQQPGHWVFAGSGLTESFGRDTFPPLVGYECDGAPLETFDPATGRAMLHGDAARCGTPRDYSLLAAAPLGTGWQDLPAREMHGPHEGLHAATMGLFSPNGTVFQAGSTDWAQVVARGSAPEVERITLNVIERLLAA